MWRVGHVTSWLAAFTFAIGLCCHRSVCLSVVCLRLLCLVVVICRGIARRPRYKYSITARRVLVYFVLVLCLQGRRRCDNKDAILSYDVCEELTVCRVDCVTSWLIQCDDLTVWWVGHVMSWLTSRLFDELVMWQFDWQPWLAPRRSWCRPTWLACGGNAMVDHRRWCSSTLQSAFCYSNVSAKSRHKPVHFRTTHFSPKKTHLFVGAWLLADSGCASRLNGDLPLQVARPTTVANHWQPTVTGRCRWLTTVVSHLQRPVTADLMQFDAARQYGPLF